MEKCPHCTKVVKHLKKHIKRSHPEQAGPGDAPGGQSDQGENNEGNGGTDLSIKEPEGKDKGDQGDQGDQGDKGGGGFHCVECGVTIQRGNTNCPSCGTRLDWTAVQ